MTLYSLIKSNNIKFIPYFQTLALTINLNLKPQLYKYFINCILVV